MKHLFMKLMIAAALLMPSAALAQTGRLDGIWLFRGLFPGATQPAYVGTGIFRADGTFTGPPVDQRTGPAAGEWVRAGNGVFVFVFVANVYDATGNFTATHRVRGVMTVSDDGLSATGRSRLEIIDTTGKVIASFNLTFTGAKLVVETI